MRSILRIALSSTLAILSLSCVSAIVVAQPPVSTAEPVSTTESKVDSERITVEAARVKAKLMHKIYSATLAAMHHEYFRDERAAVPARVLEGVFADIAEEENIKTKWIAVNARAMSINHEAKEEFDKQAVKAIKAGKGYFELVENGTYQRAEAISLMNRGCLSCHMGFGSSGKTQRFAGLVISIPVKAGE
ncbi:MAG: hypothetical protein ACI9G1_005265 [Pirellulaceae bacterium]|jgi:hypothetical protein